MQVNNIIFPLLSKKNQFCTHKEGNFLGGVLLSFVLFFPFPPFSYFFLLEPSIFPVGHPPSPSNHHSILKKYIPLLMREVSMTVACLGGGSIDGFHHFFVVGGRVLQHTPEYKIININYLKYIS